MVNTVLFDMDGTLLDTLGDLHASINAALTQNGLSAVTRDEARLAAGYGSIELIELVTKHELKPKSPMFERVHEDFICHYRKHCNDTTQPYPGIMDLLARLKEEGAKMAVVSNKIQPETERLRKLWFDDYIAFAVGREDEIKPKPDPAMALKALELMGSTQADAVFIGDSQPDVQTGKNVGCLSVGCTWGFRPREVLEAEKPDYIIDAPIELLEIIRSNR